MQGTAKIGIRNINLPGNDTYGVIYDKRTKVDLDDGRSDPTPVVVATPKVATTPVAKAAPTKKVAKPVAKPVTSKAPAKAAPVADKAKGITGVSPTRTDKHTIEIRTTINGVRKRLGFASSQKTKEAAIAAAKKEAGVA